jgi:hypothetical protein
MLGGGRPIEEIIRLIFLYFHLPLTTSDVLQLLLALVAPRWWRWGSSLLSHTHGFTLYIAVLTVKAFIRASTSCTNGGGTRT